MTNLPNLIGLGGSRCGSTWLYHQLSKNPNFSGSTVKETNYFTVNFHKRLNDIYTFKLNELAKFRFEISPSYFHSEKAPIRILEKIPDCKIFVQIRNPMKRFISLYKHHYKHHKIKSINLYVEKAILNYKKGLKPLSFKAPHHNLLQSFYFNSLSNYKNLFGDNFFYSVYEETFTDASNFSYKFSDWLEIDPIKFEVSNLINKSTAIDGAGSLRKELRDELNYIFLEDIYKTSEFTKLDLIKIMRINT